MSSEAFAMLMAAAQNEFLASFRAEDLEAIESSLCRMKQIHRSYYGFETLCDVSDDFAGGIVDRATLSGTPNVRVVAPPAQAARRGLIFVLES